jgi:hypothetical protein
VLSSQIDQCAELPDQLASPAEICRLRERRRVPGLAAGSSGTAASTHGAPPYLSWVSCT